MRFGVVPRRLVCGIVVLVTVAAWAVAEAAEGPAAEQAAAEKMFESLYGGDVEKAARTREKEDDVALAVRLLETARGKDVQPPLAAVLAEHAITLGSAHPDGYDTAVDAADLML